MKIIQHTLIGTILLCMIAHGVTCSQVCIGSSHCDSDIDWANNCHSRAKNAPASHECAFDHKDGRCVDVSVTSAAAFSGGSTTEDQPDIRNSVIIKSATSQHPFSPFDFSKFKTNIFPAFTDMTFFSIASTILII